MYSDFAIINIVTSHNYKLTADIMYVKIKIIILFIHKYILNFFYQSGTTKKENCSYENRYSLRGMLDVWKR